jgi:hypothetical protein
MAVPGLFYPVGEKRVVEHHRDDQQRLVRNVFEVSAADVEVKKHLFRPVIGDAINGSGDPVRYNPVALAVGLQPVEVPYRSARAKGATAPLSRFTVMR